MAITEVSLHRIAPGGSIRARINGSAASYLTEMEVRERLAKTGGIEVKQIDAVVDDLSAGRGEHVLKFENPGPEMESVLRKLWTGAAEPPELKTR